MGTGLSVTTTDTQTIAQQIVDVLAKAESLSQDAVERVSTLVAQAEAINQHTARVREELEMFLDQFTLESSLGAGSADQATFAGGIIDLETMRADVATMALNASRAEMLAESLKSLKSTLVHANRHFASDNALSTALEANEEHFQAGMNAAREDERQKLAREIHDGPAQVLANAVYHVQIAEQVNKRNPGSVTEELARLREMLLEGGTEVRRFMFELRPATMQHEGLGPTIRRFVEMRGSFFGRKVTYEESGEIPKLSPSEDLTIFRIVQESLQNIHKHAGADAAVDVSINCSPEQLVVRIADNGIGFDPALVAPKLNSGAGLLGMRDRAALVHASFTIESQLGKGSTVTLTLPVSSQQDLGR